MERYTRYIPMCTFVLFLAKCMINSNMQLPEVATLAALACLTAYFEFKTDNRAVVALKEELSSLKLAVKAQEKQTEEIKTHINGIKLGQNIRSSNLGR